MGWGTEFLADIYLNRLTFNSKAELEDKIEETEKSLQQCKEMILMYCSSSSDKIVDETGQRITIECLHTVLEGLFEWYNEQLKLLIDLNYYLKTNPTFKKE